MINFLEQLDFEGSQSSSDYNDELDGFFGWRVEGNTLTIYYSRPLDDDTEHSVSYILVEQQ